MNKQILFTMCLITSLTACTPTIETRGNLISEHRQEQIKPITSTKYDVTQSWGPPTLIAPFDEKTWYYVGKTTEVMGVFKEEVVKQQIIKVKFDDSYFVAELDIIDPSQAKDVDFIERTTATAGKDFTILQQLVGNLGKFNSVPKTGN